MDKKDIKKELRFLSMDMIIVLLVFVAALFISLSIVRNIVWQEKKEFDTSIFNYVGGFVSDTMTSVMNFFTFFGGQFFLIPVYLMMIAYFLFFKKNRWLGLKISAVSVSSLIIMFTLKKVFGRARPLTPLLREVNGLSFPSGHAFMSFSLCGILMYIVHKADFHRWQKYLLYAFLLTFTFFVGLSRVYLRVHYPSDVVAGFCMGILWVTISLFIMGLLEKRSTLKMEAPIS
jgi:undecaprenyl-diphosphatase